MYSSITKSAVAVKPTASSANPFYANAVFSICQTGLLRKLNFLLLTAFLVICGIVTRAQVSVTATAGTLGPTAYTNLSSAFTAINAGTHHGAITVDFSASFTDAATAVLNSSGVGVAAYTSVLIRPSADGITVSLATVTGRGIIELNGADNVTIDGDNPNTGGTNRNLTITNTATNLITYTSVIRLATSTLITSCDNVTVKNCNINGSGTARNTSSFTAEVVSWGIVASGGASTVSNTTAPGALVTAVTTIASGQTALNFSATNNAVTTCSRAISFNGAAITVCPVLTITNNTIGNSSAGAADQVYLHGISAQGFNTGTVISGNTVYVESWISTAMIGIDNGTISPNGTNGIIENNIIGRVFNNHTGGYGAYGINLASATATTNNTVRNNFLTQLINYGTAAFSTTFGVFGIRISAGTNNKIYHNSVNIFGNNAGSGTNLMACFAIVSTASTGTDVRNNIFSNTADQSGVGAISVNVCVYLPAAGTAAMNLTLNNNAYYSGTIAGKSGIAQVGTTYNAFPSGPATYGGLYLAANFNSGAISPNSNFRMYTSTLHVAGTNDNASFALTSAAPFTSFINLHIPNGTTTMLESSGAATGVANDMDGDVRSVSTPDVGADEFSGTFSEQYPPTISYTILSNVCTTGGDRSVTGIEITDDSGVPTAGALVPRIYYKKNTGSYFSQPGTLSSGTGTNGLWDFTIVTADMGGFVLGDIVSYYVIAQDISATPNISSNPSGVVAANVNTVTTHPSSPNSYAIGGSLGGTYTVGVGGNFSTLTAAVAVYNSVCGLTGPVIFSLTDATYPSENFPITINANAFASATNTLTIKPTVASVISGSSATSIILLNGADNVTIDGSIGSTVNSICPPATATRDLTIQNTSVVAGSAGVWLGIVTVPVTDGVTNCTVKNCIVIGGLNSASTLGIGVGGTAIASGGIHCDNNRIENNDIRQFRFGIYVMGQNSANKNEGNTIIKNVMTSSGTASISETGIFSAYENNLTVSGNEVDNIVRTGSPDNVGINLGFGAINGISATQASTVDAIGNATITFNKIGVITNSGTFSAAGITMGNTVSGTQIIANNTISGVAANGTAGDIAIGLWLDGGTGTTNVFHNTVSMQGVQPGASTGSQTSACFGVRAFANTLTVRNNIFSNTQGGGVAGTTTRYAAFALGFASPYTGLISNNNDLYSVGAGPGIYTAGITAGIVLGTSRTTLAAWQTETGGDAASKNVLPVFVSATNLHLVNTLGTNLDLNGSGTNIPAVTNDIDCDVRNNPPDIGADEFTPLPCSGAIGGTATGSISFFCSGTPTITASGYSFGPGSTYQWMFSTNNSDYPASGTTVTGQTNPANLSAGVVNTTTYFWLKVTCTSELATAYSNMITVTITPESPTVIASPSLICPGGTSDLNAISSGNTINWYTVPSGGTSIGSTASGANFTVNPVGTTTYYAEASALIPSVTQTYLIPISQLVNMTYSCFTYSSALKYGYGSVGFNWTDILPGNAVISLVTVELSIGVAQPGLKTTTLNDVAQPGFSTEWSYTCYIDPATNGIKTINLSPANYVPGGINQFMVTNTEGFGFLLSPTLNNSYARITVVTLELTCTSATRTPVTVTMDDLPPTITCPVPEERYNTDAGECNATLSFTAAATDNCGVASIVYVVGASPITFPYDFPVGSTTVTATATDVNGNTSSCTFIIAVMDTENPVITVQNIFSCYADNNFGCQISLGATATDNCAILSLTSNAPLCFPVGITTVTWTATDVNGNVSTKTQTVTRNPEININICAGITRTIYRGTTSGFGPFGPQRINLASAVTGGTPGYTYHWSPAAGLSNATIANPVANPAVTTTYVLTVTDSKGCSRSLGIDINVLPLSSAVCSGTGNNVKFAVCHIPSGIPSNPQNICISANALSAHLASGSNGHNNCYLGPCGQQLCFNTTSQSYQSYVKSSEVIEIKEAFSVKVRPNPSDNQFTIRVESKSKEPVAIRVYDMYGRPVYSAKGLNGKQYQFGAGFVSGTYVVEIRQGVDRSTLKLIKQ